MSEGGFPTDNHAELWGGGPILIEDWVLNDSPLGEPRLV